MFIFHISYIFDPQRGILSLSLSPRDDSLFFVLRGRREREIGILVAVWMRLMRMNHGRIDTFPFRDIVIRIDAWSNLTILLLFLPPPALLSIRESSLWAWIPDPSIPGIDQKPICDMTSGKLKLFHRWIRYIYIYISIRNSRNSKPFDRSVSKVTSFPLRIKGSFFIFSPSSLFRFFHPWKVGARDSRSRNRVVRWISRFFFRLTFFHLFSPPRFSRRVGETRLCNSCDLDSLDKRASPLFTCYFIIGIRISLSLSCTQSIPSHWFTPVARINLVRYETTLSPFIDNDASRVNVIRKRDTWPLSLYPFLSQIRLDTHSILFLIEKPSIDAATTNLRIVSFFLLLEYHV